MFNRGLLMNIGYKEAIEIYNYTCIVFHDVDLIPEDDRIYYGCGKNPRHLSVAIDIYDYKQLENVFGGVTQLPRTIMEKVNGFSNLYFGWGGEDDDLAARIKHVSSTIEINSPSVSRYSMIKHCHENSNPPNPERHALLNAATRRFKYDGLSGLRYKRLHMERNKLYTNITVEFHLDDYRQLLKRSLAHVKKGKRRRFGHSITSPPPLTPRKRDKGV
ncbi:beta-1,4-N-acetylgalactosaminyltransferase bre-4-like isoform X1 [Argopecten irradians]|uniref:beta-1,4-N-acetylgalactosaminyltransferase bre-4-like isoform X1 n=1 Tax=Argopecten irradians TaxID=31199 RepID=UPI003719E09B